MIPSHIWELVDVSCEETYYPLGVYLDAESAAEAIDSDEPPFDEHGDDTVTIEIRKRKIGFHPHEHTRVASKTWRRDYAEESVGWKADPLVA